MPNATVAYGSHGHLPLRKGTCGLWRFVDSEAALGARSQGRFGRGQNASSGRSIGSRVADSMMALSLARRGRISAAKNVAAATLPV